MRHYHVPTSITKTRKRKKETMIKSLQVGLSEQNNTFPKGTNRWIKNYRSNSGSYWRCKSNYKKILKNNSSEELYMIHCTRLWQPTSKRYLTRKRKIF